MRIAIASSSNVQGVVWRLELSAPVDGRFEMCDRLSTRAMPESTYADTGWLLVLDVSERSILVEGLGGWCATNGHYLKRQPPCSCVCHR